MELDEEKFVPIESEWFEGDISELSKTNIKLRKVKNGEKYHEFYEIHPINMLSLEINKNFISKEQEEKLDIEAGKIIQ